MARFKIGIILLLVLGFTSTTVFSKMSKPVAGNPQKGAADFKDAGFAGSTNDKSCNSCHPNGEGLADVAKKEKYKKSGNVDKALGKIVNQCISHALKGEPLELNSTQLHDMVAYLKSLSE